MARKAPSITTTTMMVPSMMVVTLGSTASSVRSVRTSRSTNTATIGPTRPPRAAAEHHAAEHDGRDAGEQIRAGDRRADAGAHGQRQPAHRGEQAGQCVGDDLGARDRHAAAEGRELARADGVDRKAEPRALERDPDDAEQTTSSTSALGIQAVMPVGHAGDRDRCRRSSPSAIGGARRRARRGSAAPRPAARTAWPASRRCRARA